MQLKRFARLGFFCLVIALVAFGITCSPKTTPTTDSEETESRTEFTDRIENFFEYQPLKAGKPSQFLIHLSDLSDGAPVEKAEVSLTVRPRGSQSTVSQTTARIGKVTGIYVADLTIPNAGAYDIDFHVKNAKLDERLPVTDFRVE
jgi:hypothetical protein